MQDNPLRNGQFPVSFLDSQGQIQNITGENLSDDGSQGPPWGPQRLTCTHTETGEVGRVGMGWREDIWCLLYLMTIFIIRVPQTSLIRCKDLNLGLAECLQAPWEQKQIWIKLHSIQRHVEYSHDFHYPCGHLGWWSSLRFNHRN